LRLPVFKSAPGTWCTCPPKYNLNVYKGRCAHGCLYCYSIKFPAFREGPPEPRKELGARIESMARNTRPIMPVMVSDCTDPYQPVEASLGLTRRCLETLIRHGFPILVVTKSDLVLRDVDVLGRGRGVISMTITALDRELARRLEPVAPSPSRRLEALRRLSEMGFYVVARIDPLFPGLTDQEEDLRELVRALAEAGVRQVTSSTFKPVRGTMSLMREADEGLYEVLEKAYRDARWIGGYLYMPAGRRYAMLKPLRDMVIAEGMEFAVCREGFRDLNTAVCDGTGPLRRGGLWDFITRG